MEGVSSLIDAALAEDIGAGDVTSEYFIPEDRLARGWIVAREAGILAGVEVAREVFRRVGASLKVTVVKQDGDRLQPGDRVMEINGSARGILTAERTALNFLQRLSGVASLTGKFVEAVAETGARILDTRKTTPGWRVLEKAAVVAGGGKNHRMGLFDRAMVKDNHLSALGGVTELQGAIFRLKEEKPEVELELEADTLDQVRLFLGLKGIDHILLDNMSLEELREAVSLRREGGPKLEASGGVNLGTVRGIAETGVDFISVGALTHSARALDLAMDFPDER